MVRTEDEKTRALGEAPNRFFFFFFNQLHGAGSRVEMHHNTHERRPGGFNGKDRGCSSGVGVTTAGLLSKHTGRWAQRPLVRLFEPRRASKERPVQLPQQTVLQEECLLEGRKKGKRDRIGRGRTAPEANPARLPAFLPYSALQPC